jgi:hypothetical protein
MKGAICNRLFQISSKTRTIEIDGSIVRRYASDTERDRESYTDVCGVAGWQQPKRLGINPTSNGFDEAHDVLLDEAELVARLDHQPAKDPPPAAKVRRAEEFRLVLPVSIAPLPSTTGRVCSGLLKSNSESVRQELAFGV